VGDRHRIGFEGFERQLLGEHHIASGETAARKETQAVHTPAVLIEHIDIHRITLTNPVAPAARSSNDVEIAKLIVLPPLRGREIGGEQAHAPLLGRLAMEDLKHRAKKGAQHVPSHFQRPPYYDLLGDALVGGWCTPQAMPSTSAFVIRASAKRPSLRSSSNASTNGRAEVTPTPQGGPRRVECSVARTRSAPPRLL
jgi:hypothetical protein